jgi:metal-responsive CopG/Arc/MetJ family transcriptional regulator
MKKFTISLTANEWDRLSKAVELSGMRTKSEFLRFLINDYVLDFYPNLKDKND